MSTSFRHSFFILLKIHRFYPIPAQNILFPFVDSRSSLCLVAKINHPLIFLHRLFRAAAGEHRPYYQSACVMLILLFRMVMMRSAIFTVDSRWVIRMIPFPCAFNPKIVSSTLFSETLSREAVGSSRIMRGASFSRARAMIRHSHRQK